MVSSSNSDVSAVALQRLLQIQYVDEVVVEVVRNTFLCEHTFVELLVRPSFDYL